MPLNPRHPRRRAPLVFAILAAGAVALLPALFAGSSEDAGPSFQGTWLRDEGASDDPLEQLEEMRAGTGAGGAASPPTGTGPDTPWGGIRRRGQGGAGAPSGGFRRPGAPLPGGSGSEGEPEEARRSGRGGASLERLVTGIESLRIEQSARQFTIENARREARVLLLDGQEMADGLGNTMRASWQGEALVIETKSERVERVETLKLDAPERLVVMTQIRAGRQLGKDLAFRTVYDRAPSSDAAPPSGDDEKEGSGDDKSEGEVVSARIVRLPRAPVPATADAPEAAREDDKPGGAATSIRLLPPATRPDGLLGGRVLLETLVTDPEIVAVEFALDGVRVERRSTLPFAARVLLAEPPREQVATVVAFDAAGRTLGEDRLALNVLDPPFRVRVAAIEALPQGGLRVEAAVSVPRKARLERVTFYRGGDREIAELRASPFVVELPASAVSPDELVRVVAVLADGRELEDARLLQPGQWSEQVEVTLAQLQVLVTDGSGVPVTGLTAADFQVIDRGQERQIERVYPARDLALVLGLAVDSSGSMVFDWSMTRLGLERFLDRILGARDRAFLVDFDSRLRLLQPLTGDRTELSWALDRLRPQGGTALYDSVLFSLLQFSHEPGRRALIVLTDGFDSESRANPNRAVEFGQRLGVPIYVIAIESPGDALPLRRPGIGQGPGPLVSPAAAERQKLELITQPTGGRLLRVASADHIARAFQQIEDELRQQYVVTFYTDRPRGAPLAPEVKLKRKGLRARSVLPLDLAG